MKEIAEIVLMFLVIYCLIIGAIFATAVTAKILKECFKE